MIPRRWLTLTALLVASFVVLAMLAPLPALAQKRIVVLDIDGAPSSRLRDQIAKMLGEKHQLISGRVYRKAARRLAATEDTADNIARVVKDIAADGVVGGQLLPDGTRYILRLRVAEGATGKTVKKLSVRLRSPRLSISMRTKLGPRLLEALEKVAVIERPADSGAPEPEPLESGLPSDTDNRRVTEIVSLVPDEVVAEPDETSDARVTGTGRSRRVQRGALVLAAGASVVTRSFTFASRDDFAAAPQALATAPAAGLYIEGELYPLAIDQSWQSWQSRQSRQSRQNPENPENPNRRGVLTDIGVSFVLDSTFVLESTAMATGATVTSTQQRYGVGLRFRYKVGQRAHGPLLKLGVGIARLSHVIDRQSVSGGGEPPELPQPDDIDVPDTVYTYLDPGLSLRVPVVAGVALLAGARAMLVLDTGPVQEPEQYGAATLTGVDADVGIEIVIGERVLMRLAGHMTLIGYAFAGNGAQSNNRDGNPATVDVGGARDLYLGGHASLGYLF